MSNSIIKTAVFPAAGLGTRFLPATKSQPKEMLPLVDKPMIQYVVEEAKKSGIEHIVLVTGRGKNAIEDHFDISFELEHNLVQKQKQDLLDEVRSISKMITVSYVRQRSLSVSGMRSCAPSHWLGTSHLRYFLVMTLSTQRCLA